MQKKKRFISVNEGFTCSACGHAVPVAQKTCRNHCPECLFSLHVDEELPGDRLSDCSGIMEPISLEIDGKKGYIITHKCESCGKIQRNKAAQDDNFEKLTELLTKTNMRHLSL